MAFQMCGAWDDPQFFGLFGRFVERARHGDRNCLIGVPMDKENRTWGDSVDNFDGIIFRREENGWIDYRNCHGRRRWFLWLFQPQENTAHKAGGRLSFRNAPIRKEGRCDRDRCTDFDWDSNKSFAVNTRSAEKESIYH